MYPREQTRATTRRNVDLNEIKDRNKENAGVRAEADALTDTDASKSKAKSDSRRPLPLRSALAAANTAVLGETTDLATLSLEDVDGSVLTPAALLVGLRRRADTKEGAKGNVMADDMRYHLWVAARDAVAARYPHAHSRAGNSTCEDPERALLQDALERLVVEVGVALQERAPGSHITFVDPRRHTDAGAVVRSARRLVGLFRARGVKASNLVVSIPATEAGVAAARELQSGGINTALDLVASLMHAVACSEARAAAISIPVGAVLVSHQRKRGVDPAAAYVDLEAHPGVESILAILEYYKLHANSTRIVGRDFGRGELAAAALRVLPGFDAVCLSKTQLNAARWATVTERGLPLAARRDRPPPPPDTHAAASLRARQAQHPTLFRTGEFMGQLSGAARGVVAATLYSALRTMERQMDAVQELVRKEVAGQLAQATLSLDALYALQDDGARAPSPVAKKKREEGVRRANQGWNSASGSEKQRQRSPPGDLVEGVEYF